MRTVSVHTLDIIVVFSEVLFCFAFPSSFPVKHCIDMVANFICRLFVISGREVDKTVKDFSLRN